MLFVISLFVSNESIFFPDSKYGREGTFIPNRRCIMVYRSDNSRQLIHLAGYNRIDILDNCWGTVFANLITVLTSSTFSRLANLSLNVSASQCNAQEGMEGNPMAGTIKNVFRGFALLTVPMTMSFPQVLIIYSKNLERLCVMDFLMDLLKFAGHILLLDHIQHVLSHVWTWWVSV